MRLQDFDTLAEAKAYETVQGRMISRHIIIATLVQAGILKTLQRMADDDENPFQDAMTGLFDPGLYDYNFQFDHPIGQANLGLLDAMIASDIGGLGADLTAVRSQFVALANPMVKPFENVTLHAFLTAKGTCPRKEVTPQGGWLTITLSQDVERHAPVVWQQVGSHFVRVTQFPAVEAAGEYIAKVSQGFSTLYVDDAYGVI